MAQAHRAPKPHYGRSYNISVHAVDRFRERVDEEFKHRPIYDLSNLLDERMVSAKKAGETFDVMDLGEPTLVFRIHNRNATESYLAVVRDNTCITVLDVAMMQESLDKGTWVLPMNTPFAKALANVKAEPIRLKAKPEALAARGLAPPAPEPPKDPIADAGAAHARALSAQLAAHVRVLAAENELAAAKVALEAANDARAKAEQHLHDVINKANPTPIPPTKENPHG